MIKKVHKLLPEGRVIQVAYGIHGDDPYFSVTGTIGRTRMRGEKATLDSIIIGNKSYEMESCGCIHEAVLKEFPDMKDIVALHLSNKSGVPMHSVENGWYYRCAGDCKTLSEHLRIGLQETVTLMEQIDLQHPQDRKAYFMKFVTDQLPRWKAEADAVIAKYELA